VGQRPIQPETVADDDVAGRDRGPEIRHELVPEFHERPPQMLDT
jgi:hypothetical protein